VRIECLHGIVLAPPLRAALCDGDHALALRIARAAHGLARLPAMTDPGADPRAGLGSFQAELHQLGFDNVLVHGSGALDGAGSMFALFGMPFRPGPRHAYFLELLLPYLHLALLRLGPDPRQTARDTPHGTAEPVRALTARELEILCWVREGKSNYEVGRILGISALTVKNHLQRIYKALGVSNRAHALARCMALRLLDAQRAR
jgi:transcriptional regulator EpsA